VRFVTVYPFEAFSAFAVVAESAEPAESARETRTPLGWFDERFQYVPSQLFTR
jgi:hypothetical protein